MKLVKLNYLFNFYNFLLALYIRYTCKRNNECISFKPSNIFIMECELQYFFI